MDAKTHRELSERLDGALEQAGILVERAKSLDGANLAAWEQVPPGAVLGGLMRVTGWKVSLVETKRGRLEGQPTQAQKRHLTVI